VPTSGTCVSMRRFSQTELARRMTDRGWSWHQSTVLPGRDRQAAGCGLMRRSTSAGPASEVTLGPSHLGNRRGLRRKKLATFAITSLRETYARGSRGGFARLRVCPGRWLSAGPKSAGGQANTRISVKLADGIEQDLQWVQPRRRARTRKPPMEAIQAGHRHRSR